MLVSVEGSDNRGVLLLRRLLSTLRRVVLMRCLFPKWKIFSLKIKGQLFPVDMLVGFLLERQFLKEGAVTHCSASVLLRDGGLAGPGLGGGAQHTAGQADWVSLSRTRDVGSERKGEKDCSSKEISLTASLDLFPLFTCLICLRCWEQHSGGHG